MLTGGAQLNYGPVQRPDTPAVESIHGKLEILSVAISNLEHNAQTLIDRLGPVSSQMATASSPDGIPPPNGMLSPVEVSVQEFIRRLALVAEKLAQAHGDLRV